jgi:hypothetical protein
MKFTADINLVVDTLPDTFCGANDAKNVYFAG